MPVSPTPQRIKALQHTFAGIQKATFFDFDGTCGKNQLMVELLRDLGFSYAFGPLTVAERGVR